jgi:tetratricopeptide (TPR) repeat protein
MRLQSALLALGLLSIGVLALAPAAAAQSSDGATERPVSEAGLATIDSLREAGAFREAYGQLTERATQPPSNAEIQWRLALTQIDMGETTDSEQKRSSLYTEALKAAQAALAVDSTNAHAHYARAVAEGRLALTAGTREKIQRSRAVKHHADRAIALDSTFSAAYHVRARWNREVADLGFFERTIVKAVYGGLPEASFEQSVRDFKTAIRLEDTIIHHLELARTYLKLDEDDRAREHLRLALEMPATDPDDPRHKENARALLDDLS